MKKLFSILIPTLFCASLASCGEDGEAATPAVPEPRLVSLIPVSGAVGSVAVISGVNFATEAAANIVEVNGVEAEVLHASAGRLTIILPQNLPGNCTVTVRVGDRIADGLTYTYVEKTDVPLALLNLVPESGYVGDKLVIYGQGFGDTPADNAVTLNGQPAEVTFAARNILHVTAPANPDGPARIVVTTGAQSASGLTFTYLHVPVLSICEVAPSSGRAGETVVLTGECFSEVPAENHLTINGVAVPVVASTATRLTVTMPANPEGTYNFRLTVDGTEIEGLPFTYVARKYFVTTVARNGTAGAADGKGAVATFNAPQDIHYDTQGMLWIVDRGTASVRKMNPVSSEVTTLVPGTEPLLAGKSPWQGDFDSKGDFYVACKDGKNIVRITPAGVCSVYEVTASNFNNPMALVFDAQDRIYLADRNNNRVVKIAGGEIVKEYSVAMPQTIAMDRDGRLIVGMYNAWKLTMIDPATDAVSVIAGSGVKPSAANYSDGSAGAPAEATVGCVDGIFCAPDKTVYFTDETSRTVRKLTPDADGDYAKGTVMTLAGKPLTQAFKDGDALLEASFSYPYALVLADDDETIYVTDGSGSRRIRKLYLN